MSNILDTINVHSTYEFGQKLVHNNTNAEFDDELNITTYHFCFSNETHINAYPLADRLVVIYETNNEQLAITMIGDTTIVRDFDKDQNGAVVAADMLIEEVY